MERPKLAQRKEQVIQEQNECKIKLGELENQILTDLNTPGDPLENEPMVERLENSKKVSEQVSIAMKESKEAERIKRGRERNSRIIQLLFPGCSKRFFNIFPFH